MKIDANEIAKNRGIDTGKIPNATEWMKSKGYTYKMGKMSDEHIIEIKNIKSEKDLINISLKTMTILYNFGNCLIIGEGENISKAIDVKEYVRHVTYPQTKILEHIPPIVNNRIKIYLTCEAWQK
jgi:DNA-binding protein